jgi:hypothetical protein
VRYPIQYQWERVEVPVGTPPKWRCYQCSRCQIPPEYVSTGTCTLEKWVKDVPLSAPACAEFEIPM